MAEDYTTYTEVDPFNRVQIDSATKVSGTNIPRSEQTYIYKDKGVDFFSGDFEHLLDSIQTLDSGVGIFVMWYVSNFLGTIQINDNFIGCYWINNGIVTLIEDVSGSVQVDASAAQGLSNRRWLEIERDETIGANGTAIGRIYSNAGRSVLVDTVTLTLNAKQNLRYIYAIASLGAGAGAGGLLSALKTFHVQEWLTMGKTPVCQGEVL
jgi:hypothetical protein